MLISLKLDRKFKREGRKGEGLTNKEGVDFICDGMRVSEYNGWTVGLLSYK